jgi:hypothetical protein
VDWFSWPRIVKSDRILGAKKVENLSNSHRTIGVQVWKTMTAVTKFSQHQYWIIWCSPNLISWRIVLLQKPTVVQLVTNSSPSLKPRIKYCGRKRSPLTSIFIYLNPLCAHNLPHIYSDLAPTWPVTCLSLRQHDFNPRSTNVWISGRNSGTGTSLSPSTEVFPCKCHQPMLHSHSHSCHRRYMCLAIANLVKYFT